MSTGGSKKKEEEEKGGVAKNDARGGIEASEKITADAIEKMVQDAIKKQMEPEEEPLTLEAVGRMIEDSVAKAMEPVLKSAGLPTNMNDTVQKSSEEEHYLHGFI